MREFLQRLRERKLAQWALAYAAGAWVMLQVLSLLAGAYHWPDATLRIAIGVAVTGFLVALTLAWFHGERGAQRVSRGELALLFALALCGTLVIWRSEQRAGDASAPAVASAATAAHVATTVSAKSIAVLPFENLSSDKENEYFASGMQDLILTRLADIGELKVISRTSTEKYKSRPDDLTTVAQQLGVANILEGSVQKAGNQVLINVQLIDARNDNHLWADTYQRTLDNIFGVEGEVAQKIADALKAKLTPPQALAVAMVPTRNPQAYDDFLRAQHFFNEAKSTGAWETLLPQTIAGFESAVQQDPEFALAWAGLSYARTESRYFAVDRSTENLRLAEQNAQRALALAPDLPEGHLAMAEVYRFTHNDYVAAREEAKRALQLRPNYTEAFYVLSIIESHLGNYEEANAAAEHGVALDPQNSRLSFTLGMGLVFTRDYVGAREALQRALAINPQNAEAYALLSEVDILQSGDVDAASKVLDTMAPGTPPAVSVAPQRIRLQLYRRDFAAARTLAAALSETPGDSSETAMLRADVEWLSGDRASARTLYRTAVDLLRNPSADIDGADRARLALAYARLGQADEATQKIDDAKAFFVRSTDYTGQSRVLFYLSIIHLALDHSASAIDALGQVLARPGCGSISPALLRLDPTWDALRSDPGFKALLTQEHDTRIEKKP